MPTAAGSRTPATDRFPGHRAPPLPPSRRQHGASRSSPCSRRLHPELRVLPAWPPPDRTETEGLSCALQKSGQLGRSLELRNGVELFECRGESVGEAPQRAALKLLVLRVEVQVMNRLRQMPRHLQVGLDERAVDD